MTDSGSEEEVLYEGKHLSLKRRAGWEYVERRGRAEGVLVVAVTADDEILLVEEERPPVSGRVVSLPAGLVGDHGPEDPAEAAARELAEETGYSAPRLDPLGGGPSSPGLASECVTFFLARDARRTGEPTGEEEITLHRVPRGAIDGWLRQREREGVLVHPLLWAGLYLAFMT